MASSTLTSATASTVATVVKTAAEAVADTVAETKTVAAKKSSLAKKGSTVKTPIREGSHINTTMPDPLVIPKAPEGCIKISSWNVSGLNASLKKVRQNLM